MDLQQTMTQATTHLRAGQLAQAEALYRAVLAQSPNLPDALHLLGCTLSKTGKPAEAVDLISRAIALDPKQPVFQHNLGLAFLAAGRKSEAISAFARCLLLKPDSHNARLQLGTALSDIGQFDQAVECLTPLLQVAPKEPGLHYNLGNCYFRKATSILPGEDPSVLRTTPAEQQALLEKAVAAYEKAISLDPRFAPARNNLAMTLWVMHRPDEAIAAWRRAATEVPDFPTWYNLGRALAERDQPDEAIDAIENSLRLNATHPDPFNNLGNVYRQRGQIDQALTQFDHAISIQPNLAVAQSNRLYTLYYQPNVDAQTILAAHQRWNETIAARLAQQIAPHPNDRTPNRKLKIGYVSPLFWEHCQALFTIPLLSHHDHQNFEIYCYSDVKTPDAATAKLRGFADAWRPIVGMTDEKSANLIRQDEIDILVDLTLHMAENRMLLFARKPAPVQVTWLGYPGTTGLQTIDYRLTDPYLDPITPAPGIPGEGRGGGFSTGPFDAHYTEKSLRLPHTFWCINPETLEAPDIPAPNPLPAQTNNHITFGCLNNFCKVNQPLLELWKRVLDSVPNSRLILLAPPGWCQSHVRQTLGDRVDFVLRATRPEYMKYYHRIDIGLDTLPYNGHTTSLDSFWMGVPVISLIGNTVVGRAGFSQLSNLNLADLATKSPDQFVERAAQLAADLPRLSELRRTLRDRMRASPLMNAPQFTRDVESAYRQMWLRYCGAAE